MTPEQVRELAEFLPRDWEGLGPALTIPSIPAAAEVPPQDRAQWRAYNPPNGPARTFTYPLTLQSATPAEGLLLLQFNWSYQGELQGIVWVVDFSHETSSPFDVKLLSSVLWGRLAPLLSSQFVSENTVEIGPKLRIIVETKSYSGR